jgi:hypothetical protein
LIAQDFWPTQVLTVAAAVVTMSPKPTAQSNSCFPFGNGSYFYNSFGDVRIGQVNGATGDSFFHPTCNDRSQTHTVFVPGPFTRGDAAISASVCGFDCNFASREVRIR